MKTPKGEMLFPCEVWSLDSRGRGEIAIYEEVFLTTVVCLLQELDVVVNIVVVASLSAAAPCASACALGRRK